MTSITTLAENLEKAKADLQTKLLNRDTLHAQMEELQTKLDTANEHVLLTQARVSAIREALALRLEGEA